MKQFYDVRYAYLSEQENSKALPDIYIDLDGVLVNIEKGAKEALLPKYPKIKHWLDVDTENRWKVINNTKDFWKNLEWMPNSRRLWKIVSQYSSHVLSAYSQQDDRSKRDKLIWVNKNMGLFHFLAEFYNYEKDTLQNRTMSLIFFHYLLENVFRVNAIHVALQLIQLVYQLTYTLYRSWER